MTKLGGGIDKLDIDSLQVLPGRMNHHTLTHNKRSLLHTNNSTLEHNPVLIDLSVLDESSHGGDALLGKIGISLTRSLISLLSDTVNLLVKFSTVEVTILTSTCHSGGNTSRMP